MSGVEERRAALVGGEGTVPDAGADTGTVADADRRAQRIQGHQVMAAAASFGQAIQSGRMQRAVTISHYVCITFVCVTPVLLFWSVALNG